MRNVSLSQKIKPLAFCIDSLQGLFLPKLVNFFKNDLILFNTSIINRLLHTLHIWIISGLASVLHLLFKRFFQSLSLNLCLQKMVFLVEVILRWHWNKSWDCPFVQQRMFLWGTHPGSPYQNKSFSPLQTLKCLATFESRLVAWCLQLPPSHRRALLWPFPGVPSTLVLSVTLLCVTVLTPGSTADSSVSAGPVLSAMSYTGRTASCFCVSILALFRIDRLVSFPWPKSVWRT